MGEGVREEERPTSIFPEGHICSRGSSGTHFDHGSSKLKHSLFTPSPTLQYACNQQAPLQVHFQLADYVIVMLILLTQLF